MRSDRFDPRWAVTGLAALAMMFAVVVFDAVYAADQSTALRRRAAFDDDHRAVLLIRAEETVNESWSRAGTWHAGASEAASWAASRLGADGDASALKRAQAAAARTVSLSPVAPIAWMRLAALSARDGRTPICVFEECLARSWASARVIEPEPGCARLQLSVAAGLVPSDDDPRFDEYVSTLQNRDNARVCFALLPQERSFRQIMRLGRGEHGTR